MTLANIAIMLVLGGIAALYFMRGGRRDEKKPSTSQGKSALKRLRPRPQALIFYGTLLGGVGVIGWFNMDTALQQYQLYGKEVVNTIFLVVGALLVWAMPTKLQKVPGLLMVLFAGFALFAG